MTSTSNVLYEQASGNHAHLDEGLIQGTLFSLNLESDGCQFHRMTWTALADSTLVMTVKLGVTG